ncbi:MAG TPA: hypothetical protein PLD47_12315 [Aggregatilineales bacterium]|nr:hypothetical protein [Anaerolineales bacterium]HRE48500.1 hypothetical protein [Aggregatilineales bacterium]
MTIPIIRFTPDGSTLIYANAHQIQFWRLQDRYLLHQHDGKLIGMAKDGRSFLLESTGNRFQLFDLFKESYRSNDSILSHDYLPGQRCSLRLKRRSIEVFDVLQSEVVVTVQLSELVDTSSGNPYFSNACLSQDGGFVAVTVAGDSTWGEWARGYCLHLGGRPHFEFSVNCAANQPVLQMSGHILLVENTNQHRTLWDIYAGKAVQVFDLTNGRIAGRFVAVNEAEFPSVVAIHTDRNRVELYQASLLLATLTTQHDICAAEFYPDNRHIALLLENKEVEFYDWRTTNRKGLLKLTGSTS